MGIIKQTNGKFIHAIMSAAQTPEIIETCSRCRKPIGHQRPGSFTAWVFRPNICNCQRNFEQKKSEVPGVNQKANEEVPFVAPTLPDRFEVSTLLGRGGMGEVFMAHDKLLDSTVAIKIMKKEIAADENRVQSFEREVKAMMDFDHPNLAAIFDYGTTNDGIPFSVLEYIEGKPIDEATPDESLFLDSHKAINVFIQICEGLAHAHARGVIHLDLKPSNVMRCKRNDVDIVKILDFGNARAVAQDTQSIAESDEIVGSLPYMSPEQLNAEPVDFRSDIYSMGCLMFEILTGTVPFEADNPVKIIVNHLDGLPKGFTLRFKRLEAPRGLEQIIRHCLELKADNRYQCVEELTRDLELVRDGHSPQIVQQQVQLRQQSLALLNEGQRKALKISFGLSVLAYMVYLGKFDTTMQFVLFFKTAIFCVFIFLLFQFLLYLRRHSIEIDQRIRIPARTREGDLWLWVGTWSSMLSTTLAIAYCVAQILVANEYRLFAYSLGMLVQNESTLITLITFFTISIIPIFAGLYKSASSLQLMQNKNPLELSESLTPHTRTVTDETIQDTRLRD